MTIVIRIGAVLVAALLLAAGCATPTLQAETVTPTARTSPAPTAIPTARPTDSEAPAAAVVNVEGWQAECYEVAEADCLGASERFINLLASSSSGVFRQSRGHTQGRASAYVPDGPRLGQRR